jgi:predicted ester cyclase
MTDLAANRAVVNRFHDLAQNADLTEAATLLHPDFRGFVTGLPEMDRTQFKAMGEAFHGSFSNFKTTILRQLAEGDTVWGYGTWEVVHTGTFNGIPPTGRAVKVDMVFMDRVRDGKLIEERTVMDMLGLMTQIGAIPAPAAAAA